MLPPPTESTDLLILRKTPYQENGEIVSGISPEHGRMSFYVRIPSPRSRRHDAPLDIFQEAHIEYRTGRRDMLYGQNASVVGDYTGVARNVNGFENACILSRFALSNMLPQVAMPGTYLALRVALVRLQDAKVIPNGVLTGVGLTFLNESGLLSPVELTPREAAQCQILLTMASGGDIPALESGVWDALWDWTRARLVAADCKDI